MSQETNDQARTWGMACHLSALTMFLCIPGANVLGPLVVWLMKKSEFPFVDDQGKEAVNFQITMAIAGVVIMVLAWIVPLIGGLGILLFVFNLVFMILGSIAAKNGTAYRYPVALRLIK
ncbi:MAG: DUF4870 domain-containing protein [Candidatus Hydrogenedentes bacterium]|nr:DUF4870 domain-containing protein [Candidatus Hydrogenedentota bacterium]